MYGNLHPIAHVSVSPAGQCSNAAQCESKIAARLSSAVTCDDSALGKLSRPHDNNMACCLCGFAVVWGCAVAWCQQSLSLQCKFRCSCTQNVCMHSCEPPGDAWHMLLLPALAHLHMLSLQHVATLQLRNKVIAGLKLMQRM